MLWIDLNEKLTFHLKDIEVEDFFEKYVKGFYDNLGYNISVVNKESKNHLKSVYELINFLNSKRDYFTLSLEEIYPNKIFSFKKDKTYESAKEFRDFVLSLVFEIHHFVNVAKRIKTFLDSEKDSLEKTAFFKDGFVYFNLTGIDNYSQKVQQEAEDFKIKFDVVNEDDKPFIKFPLERLMLLDFSNYEISVLLHLIMSAYKYIYSLDNCGEDFTKRCELRAEFNKWKNTALCEVEDILKRR